MNENWNNNEYEMDPWDRGTYQTGATRHRKSHRGLIALLLVLIIFLCGVVSILTLLNIRIFMQTNENKHPDDDYISYFSTEPPETTASTEATETVLEAPPAIKEKDATIAVETSPYSVANIPQEGGLSFQEIYIKAIPSVVSVSCTYPGGSSTGTGVVLTRDGYIVTNCHVVEDAREIQVQLTDDRILNASVVGLDATTDLAVLYVKANDLTPAQFGDSDMLLVGDSVAAIGDPFGVELRGTMTPGIISGLNRIITTGGRTMNLIQTNAALNSGNSGGPLLNCYGQVIGINTMKIGDSMSSYSGVEGIGFAIPSKTVQEIVNQLISQGYVSGRPTIGISGTDIQGVMRFYYRYPEGLYIEEVTPGSDAEEKGLQPGDILLMLGKTRITGNASLKETLYGYEVGDQVEAIIYRSGKQYSVTLTIEEANG